MNPIKRSKEWLKDAFEEFFENITKNDYRLLLSPQSALLVILAWHAIDLRFRQPAQRAEINAEAFTKDQISYSQAIDSNSSMKREFDLMLADDLSALRSIYRTSLNEAQYDAIAYFSRELKMSPFRFIKFLEKTKIPFYNNIKLLDTLKELKQATSLTNLRVVENVLFEKEYERRGNLAYRKDLSKELQYMLKRMQSSQTSFLSRYQKSDFYKSVEQRMILERTRRELKERSLPKGPQGRINKPRSNLRA